MTMRGMPMERAPFIDQAGEPTRQKVITVLVLNDSFAGALAYALQSVLRDPARIHVVRVGERRGRDHDLGIPLPVLTITADDADAVVRQCSGDDVIVVESPRHLELTDSLLVDVRRDAPCLVVEVDDQGRVVSASGPEGWSYADSPQVRALT